MNYLDKLILEIIEKRNGRPLTKKVLVSLIHKEQPDTNVKEIFRSLRFLDQKFLISFNNLGKIKAGYVDGDIIPDSKKSGIIFINNIGDGFVKVEGENTDYYVNRKNVHGGLSGDLVEIVLTNKQTKKNVDDAIVTNVLERNRFYFVGTISIFKNITFCNLDDHKISQRIQIVNPHNLVNGHKVWIKALEFSPEMIKAEVVKVIGHQDDVGMDIVSVVYNHGIEPDFDQEVENFANNLDTTISQEERQRRIDLTNLPIVTIDPATSKDLDDAIFVLSEGEKFRLFVSIADVAHFVRPNTVLDDCARERGTSIYLVDKVVPMLPHIISNDICSLNPQIEKLAMTCEILISANGDFEEVKVYDSIIKSKQRFSYDDVNQYFATKNRHMQINEDIWPMLDTSYQLFKILQSKLVQRGYIDFEIKEPKILLDEKGNVSDVAVYDRGEAQMLIEAFMVAANEAVTIFYNLKFKDAPFIYRIHEKPSDAKLANFKIEAKKMNFVTRGDVFKITSKMISNWIQDNAFVEPKKSVLNKLLLKTMMKAEYSTKNIGHFGLASSNYTHFTSPIRRYPDILVHRLFKMQETNVKAYTKDDLASVESKLVSDAKNALDKEIQAVEIERDVNSLKFCQFMKQKIGQEFKGMVTHVGANGVFIELENLIEGMARLSNIDVNDFFQFDKDQNVLVGSKTKKVIGFGSQVKISVKGVNVKLRQIDFSILELIDANESHSQE